MATPYGIKFAVHLINNHFGDLVSKVCESLMEKGPLTFDEIERFVGIKAEKVRNSLLVLIQHNCVQAFVQELPGDLAQDGNINKNVTKYFAVFNHIIHRGRFEKFLDIVKQDFDPPCFDLMEGLFQHGRLSLDQLRARFGQLSKAEDVDSTLENLKKLVTSRYVERCPKPEPSVDPPQDEEPPKKKRGATKSAEVVTSPETLEQRALIAAASIDAVRFSIPTCFETFITGEHPGTVMAGEKRKREEAEFKLDHGGNEEKVVLWRPNFEEFIVRLRVKACIESVRDWIDDRSVLIFNAMLEGCKNVDTKMNTKRSVPLSLEAIYEEVIKNQNMTIDHVRDALGDLCSSFGFITMEDESYTIDFERIIEVAQTAEVESVVMKRYGVDSLRMFKFLLKTRRLTETDKISDTALVEKKDAAKHLYKMWQDGYLHLERIVAGAQFLLWKVDRFSLWNHVLNEMFHAALNLSLRAKHEKEQAQEGMTMENKTKLRKVQLMLYSSLMKLDNAIMLFHDF